MLFLQNGPMGPLINGLILGVEAAIVGYYNALPGYVSFRFPFFQYHRYAFLSFYHS